jgi:multicomponent Na+:H+ antiporter subunit D
VIAQLVSQHLPALQVVLPLIAAPVCVLLRRASLSWLFAMIVTWACFAISIALLVRLESVGTIVYEMGGWPAPWGIEYRIGMTSAIVLVIVSGIGSIVMPYAKASVAAEIDPARHYLFYTCYLLCLCGLLGVVATGDAFNLFVFLEISSLSSYVLIGLGRDRRALTAAFQYLIMGTIGATSIVIGIGLLYLVTGSLNMADIAARLPEPGTNRTVLVAFAFLGLGAALKLALFPLHVWLPAAYTHAPSAVTVFLAATATKVGVYILLRFIFTVFGADFAFTAMPLDAMLLTLAVAAMFAASALAIFQNNVKRMLAYSSVAQIGYMILGIGIATMGGVAAGLIHLFNHALMKGGLFMALGCVFLRTGSMRFETMAGIARTMPWTMAAFVLGGLSLIGVPLTVGFISKLYLIRASFEAGLWPLGVLVVLSSLLAVAYIWRVVETAYFREPTAEAARATEAPLSMLIPTWVLIGACIYFGIDAELTVDTAFRAAGALMQANP